MIATNPQPPIVHLSPGPREATWSKPHSGASHLCGAVLTMGPTERVTWRRPKVLHCTLLHPHHPQRHYDGARRVSFRSDQEASAGWEEL
jgi:hypothetical protein